jgi:tellurite resistance protein
MTTGAVSEELLTFGVKGSDARKVLLSLFRDAVKHFLADDEMNNAEAAYLDRLRLIFGVTNREMDEVQSELVEPRYAAAVENAVADDRLTPVETRRLEDIRRRLGLDERTATAIRQQAAQQRLTDAAARATSDGRLSPDEVTALYAIAAGLGAQLSLDDRSRAAFERMQLLWHIDNGDLPQIHVPINLQKNEACHAQIGVVWHETRTRTVRTNYHGGTVSIRICKGVRYRVGSVAAQRITREELVEIDRGTMYVTSKRLIFDGSRKNTTIRLSAILSFSPCSDGLVLEKATGKPVQLEFAGGDAEMFHSILSAAMNADAG